MATVTKTRIGTHHVIAECSDCDWRDEDYQTAAAKARRHAARTGHRVTVERGQTWTYNLKRRDTASAAT